MPRDLDLESGHVAYCHASLIDFYLHTKFHSNQRTFCGRTDGQTDVHIYGCTSSLVGAYAQKLGPCAYAAENQHVGKTRRRSIYSVDTPRTDANQPTGQPAKVTVM